MAKPSYYKAQSATVTAAPSGLAPDADLVYQEINYGMTSPNFDVTGEGDADLMLVTGIATHNVQAQCVKGTNTSNSALASKVQTSDFTSAWTELDFQAYDWVCGTRWNLIDVTSTGSSDYYKNWEWQKPTCYFSIRGWALDADPVGQVPELNAARAEDAVLALGDFSTIAGTATDGEGAILDRADVGVPHRTGGPVPVRLSGRAAGGWNASILGMGGADPPRGTLTAHGIENETYIAWDIQVRYRRGQGGPIPVTVNFIMDEG